MMRLNRRTIIFGIVFWILLLASVVLDDRHRWLDTAWLFACLAFGAIASVFSIMEMFRNRRTSGEYLYYRGVPRWMRWFLQDEDQYAKDLERRKNTAARSATRE
jgi:hypothetical protein